MMASVSKQPPTIDEATKPVTTKPSADVGAWQDAKVRAAIKAADAGEFASDEEVRRVVQKYVPQPHDPRS